MRSCLSAWKGSSSAEWSMRNADVAVSTTNRELERTLRAEMPTKPIARATKRPVLAALHWRIRNVERKVSA